MAPPHHLLTSMLFWFRHVSKNSPLLLENRPGLTQSSSICGDFGSRRDIRRCRLAALVVSSRHGTRQFATIWLLKKRKKTAARKNDKKPLTSFRPLRRLHNKVTSARFTKW